MAALWGCRMRQVCTGREMQLFLWSLFPWLHHSQLLDSDWLLVLTCQSPWQQGCVLFVRCFTVVSLLLRLFQCCWAVSLLSCSFTLDCQFHFCWVMFHCCQATVHCSQLKVHWFTVGDKFPIMFVFVCSLQFQFMLLCC